MKATPVVSVALVGPDGVGKTTIARRLERTLPVRVKYIYMGDNAGASNIALPTTRLFQMARHARGTDVNDGGPPRLPTHTPGHRSVLQSIVSGLVWLNHQIAEEWFRQVVAWWYECRGTVVLFDRHFFCDYYAHEIERGVSTRSIKQRIHGFMLDHLFPKPDLVVFLDAPSGVLFSRKAEGTLQDLERRRQEYPRLRAFVRRFETVDATQAESDVATQVGRFILDLHANKAASVARSQ